MSNDPPDVPLEGVVDAFLHPPRLAYVGYRSESSDGRILILGHVELWPWRVVVRGTLAHKRGSGRLLRRAGRLAPPGDQEPGSVTGRIVELKPASAEARWRQAEAMWVTSWQLGDDVGTTYHPTGSRRGGNETWEDFSFEFQPPVPASATLLNLRTADGTEIEVPFAEPAT